MIAHQPDDPGIDPKPPRITPSLETRIAMWGIILTLLSGVFGGGMLYRQFIDVLEKVGQHDVVLEKIVTAIARIEGALHSPAR